MKNIFTALIGAMAICFASCKVKDYTCHCVVVDPTTGDTAINYRADYSSVTQKQAEKSCQREKADFEEVWTGVACKL